MMLTFNKKNATCIYIIYEKGMGELCKRPENVKSIKSIMPQLHNKAI